MIQKENGTAKMDGLHVTMKPRDIEKISKILARNLFAIHDVSMETASLPMFALVKLDGKFIIQSYFQNSIFGANIQSFLIQTARKLSFF